MATYQVDPAHTDITFSAKHMMVTTVRGRFGQVDGEFELDEAEPTRSQGAIRVAAASLSTGVEPRDQHLRSGDFFDAETYPTIEFRTTAIEPGDAGSWRVTGDLTIRDTTRPLTLAVDFLGFYASIAGARRAGFSGRATLARKDWGLGWNVALEAGGWLVSENVDLEFDVALEQVAETPEQPAETPEQPADLAA